MSVSQAIVAVATGATKICENDGNSATRTFKVSNVGAASVYVGTTAVTTSAYGDVIAAGGWLIVELDDFEALYGAVASSTVNVAVLGLGNR